MRYGLRYNIVEVIIMIDRPMYVEKIMRYVDTPFVKVLTGVRRCGKSTILNMIMERLRNECGIPDDRIVSCRFATAQPTPTKAAPAF